MNKKGDGGISLGLIVLVVIGVWAIGWLIQYSDRECKYDSQCGSNSYCGADFNCHEKEVITKTLSPTQVNFSGPAFILGLSAIIVALIFKWDAIFKRKEEQPKEKKADTEHKAEPKTEIVHEATEEEPDHKEQYKSIRKLNRSHKAEDKGQYEDDLEHQEPHH